MIELVELITREEWGVTVQKSPPVVAADFQQVGFERIHSRTWASPSKSDQIKLIIRRNRASPCKSDLINLVLHKAGLTVQIVCDQADYHSK